MANVRAEDKRTITITMEQALEKHIKRYAQKSDFDNTNAIKALVCLGLQAEGVNIVDRFSVTKSEMGTKYAGPGRPRAKK